MSVIIPSWNVGTFVGKCLQSVISQTFSDIEIICVDDGSDDDTLSVINSFAAEDSRIRVFADNIHLDVSTRRNFGISQARGRYVCFIDSDDWIDPDYIEALVDKSEKSGADVVLNVNIIQEFDNRRKSYFGSKYKDLPADGRFFPPLELLDLSLHKLCTVWCCLYRKKFLDDFDIRFPVLSMHENLFFQNIMFNSCSSALLFSGPEYHWRQRCDSRMHKDAYNIQSRIEVLDKLFEVYSENNRDVKKSHFVSLRFLVDGLDEFGYAPACDFIARHIDFMENFPDCFNELDRYIARALLENLSWADFRAKYSSDICSFWIFFKLRSGMDKAKS